MPPSASTCSGTFYVGPTLLIAARFDVREGGPLDGMAVGDFEGRAQAVAIRRAGPTRPSSIRPRPSRSSASGDSVYLIGQYDDLLGLLQRP